MSLSSSGPALNFAGAASDTKSAATSLHARGRFDHTPGDPQTMATLKSIGVGTKLLLLTALLLAIVAIANFAVFLPGYARDVQATLVDKAGAFTAVADETKNHVSKLQSSKTFDVGPMLEEVRSVVAANGDYKTTRFFRTIPVVAGWQAAGEAATREGIDFNVVSFNARNKANEPAAGSFTAGLLRELESAAKDGKTEFVSGVDTKTNTLHYLRAIRLDESCMMCHGDPAKYDQRDAAGNYDGKDILGFTMENWKPGDTHGAFEVKMPLDKMDAQVAGFFKLGLGVTVLASVLGFAGFFFMLRSLLTRPVARLVKVAEGVAAGDLTQRLALNRGDEIGTLGQSFDKVADNLSQIIGEVKRSAADVAAASTEIAASAEEMAAGLNKQESQTSQVSAAVTQMSQSVSEVAKQSAEATQAAAESGREANSGGDVVAKSISEMEAIAQQVNSSATVVGALGKKSEEIGQIIGVINDIADQTNLLALNAAIEAARAGEHGRGFAVVADEVRKLAERTTKATEEVANSIRQIQGDTGTAVRQIEDSTKRVSTGVELANSAGQALERIVASSNNVQTMVQNIAAAATEQAAASEQISRSVEAITAISRESSQGAQQTAQAVTQLSSQAEKLRTLVDRFKVNEAGQTRRGS
ncbi:MAG: methyl-accepting chemotaxis protein [Phycisphaerae bacterium]|nr:methyl-accepting chemotaxis protein [Phycisphaerae bacterium]